MSAAAIAHQIDHHIVLELVAVIHGHLGHEHDRLGIVRVHVQDRGLNHLGHIGAVFRGTGIFLLAGGKTDLVVDDDMNSTANTIAPGLGHLEGFHNHTLPGERCVTVHDDGHTLGAVRVVAPGLAGTD